LTARAALHWFEQTDIDAWGAFMFLIPQTRKALERSGVLITTGSFRELPVQSPRWKDLLSRLAADSLTSAELLHFARLLLFLNFVDDVPPLIGRARTRATSASEVAWADVLAGQTQRLQGVEGEAAALGPPEYIDGSANLNLQRALLATVWSVQDDKASNSWLSIAQSAAENAPREYRPIARARVARYEALLEGVRGDGEAAERRLARAASDLAAFAESSPARTYLARETERRLADARFRSAMRGKRLEVALASALRAVELDPFCARAHLFAGEALSLLGRRDEAEGSLFIASRLGSSLERSRAGELWSQCGDDADRRATRLVWAVECAPPLQKGMAIHSGVLPGLAEGQRPPLQAWLQRFDHPQGPGLITDSADAQRALEGVLDDRLEQQLLSSRTYNLFSSYWTLGPVQTPGASLMAACPTALARSMEYELNPLVETISMQRAMTGRFRAQLWAASQPNLLDSQRAIKRAYQLEDLRGRSAACDTVLDAYEGRLSLSPIRRSVLARLLAALGFHAAALEANPPIDWEKPWTPEDHYAVSTHLFVRFVVEGYASIDEHARAFACSIRSPETLRARYSFAIRAIVLAGRRGDKEETDAWRPRLLQLVYEVQDSSLFSDFEKGLLLTRAYRATGFASFLNDREEELRHEMEHCEEIARGLQAQNDWEELLFRDNLYPMLESCSRTYAAIGDHERSISMMMEIVQEVDPSAPKAWAQVGELHESAGQLDEAYQAFTTAGRLGVPYGEIGWYRAGRLAEKRGDTDTALECYWHSFRAWPAGISPLIRIAELTGDTHNSDLRCWALEALGSLRTKAHLSEDLAARVDGLMAG